MGTRRPDLLPFEPLAGAPLQRALRLYQDAELLRFALDRLALSDVERVAIPLTADAAPPHLVVGRDGAFVTCVGSGRDTGAAQRVDFAGLEAAMRDVEAWRALMAEEPSGLPRALERLFSAGQWFDRRDFEDLVVCASVLPEALPPLMAATALSLRQIEKDARTRMPRKDDLVSYWRDTWALSHLGLALAEATIRLEACPGPSLKPRELATLVGTPADGGLFGPMVRAAWSLGRLGERLRGVQAEALGAAGMPRVLAALGFLMWGLREPERRGEIVDLLVARLPVAVRGRARGPVVRYHAALVSELLE
ncbi:MAG: hypothetical protein R3F60_25735, partial [bacterium]